MRLSAALFSVFRLLGIVAALAGLLATNAHAAGTITVTDTTPATFTAGPFVNSNKTFRGGVAQTCAVNAQGGCDTTIVQVRLPDNFDVTNPNKRLRAEISWTNAMEDYDLYLSNTANCFGIVGQSEGSSNPEVVTIPAGKGSTDYRLCIIAYQALGGSVNAKVSIVDGPPPVTPTPFTGLPPRYELFVPPTSVDGRNSSGEINIGYNPKTGRFMLLAFLSGTTLRITPPELLTPKLPESCEALWEDRTPLAISQPQVVGDPILFTDGTAGRTWVSNFTAGANYSYAYTDNDGDAWTEAGVAPPNGGADHQTIGSGPYPAGSPFQTIATANGFPNAVYYCSQGELPDFCQRSDDGGRTYGPGNAINTGTGCGGLHGHVRVDRKGSVYVPDKSCGAGPGYSVSDDAGVTWRDVVVKSATIGGEDPSVGIDAAGKVYFCNVNNDGHPHVLTSKDKGVTWDTDTDIGATFGIKNAVFTNAIAGDDGRATCGFIGTTVAGNHDALDFSGIWYGYLATTYDGGKSWATVSFSPNDPVQGVGGICRGGTVACMNTPNNRNLLDFNEITLDNFGRPAYAFDDGCVGDCVKTPTTINLTAQMTIARQFGGRSLLAKYDKTEPTVPNQACLAGTRSQTQSNLTWRVPDTGGAAISGYKIFRSTSPTGPFTFIGDTGPAPSYVDPTADPNVVKYYYQITALNSSGEGLASNIVELPIVVIVPETSCKRPGLTVLTSPAGLTGNGLPTGQDDLRQAWIAEPADLPGKLVLTMKMANLSTVPPNYRWIMYFNLPNDTNSYFAAMDSVAQATPRFIYGTRSATATPAASFGTFAMTGTLDAASKFSADGTIELVIDKASFPTKITTGMQLTGVAASIRQTTNPQNGVGLTVDSATGDNYSVVGNVCPVVNTAPLPVLDASPTSGAAPLAVAFTINGSDADAGDKVASYSLDFGDGQSVSDQAVTTLPVQLSHSYTAAGTYTAKLTVKDTRGLASATVAQKAITVTPVVTGGGGGGGTTPPVIGAPTPSTPASAPSREEGRFGGGAFSFALLPLLLAARRRRR